MDQLSYEASLQSIPQPAVYTTSTNISLKLGNMQDMHAVKSVFFFSFKFQEAINTVKPAYFWEEELTSNTWILFAFSSIWK